MNRPALRHSLRSVWGWVFVAITGAYIAFSITSGVQWLTMAICATVFAIYALVVFGYRYQDHIHTAEREARNAARDAELAESRARQRALLDRLEADRAEREAERTRKRREDVLAGRRCPEWCDDCAEEERESERRTAEFLAERASRHGHPNAGDVEILDEQDRQEVLAMMADQQYPPRAA